VRFESVPVFELVLGLEPAAAGGAWGTPTTGVGAVGNATLEPLPVDVALVTAVDWGVSVVEAGLAVLFAGATAEASDVLANCAGKLAVLIVGV
jgi:hypothetical protein